MRRARGPWVKGGGHPHAGTPKWPCLGGWPFGGGYGTIGSLLVSLLCGVLVFCILPLTVPPGTGRRRGVLDSTVVSSVSGSRHRPERKNLFGVEGRQKGRQLVAVTGLLGDREVTGRGFHGKLGTDQVA